MALNAALLSFTRASINLMNVASSLSHSLLVPLEVWFFVCAIPVTATDRKQKINNFFMYFFTLIRTDKVKHISYQKTPVNTSVFYFSWKHQIFLKHSVCFYSSNPAFFPLQVLLFLPGKDKDGRQ